jgi:hypothetical protein
MAISNYAELQTAVGEWLHRSDLTGKIPDFITLAEAKINRVLRIRAMENIATGTPTNPTALPTGFVEMIALTVTNGGASYPLTYIPPAQLTGDTATPNRYTLIGDNIYFEPSGSGTYSLTYYKKFDPLSSGVNWLITNAPDVYLYATLLEASPYLVNDGRIQTWYQMLDKTVEQLQRADKADRYGSDLIVRPA